jgi:ribosomal protein S18 acetylase RimI-like enzyme
MKLREAKVEDAEEIEKAARESWLDAYEGIHTEEALNEIREKDQILSMKTLKDTITDNSTIFLVVEKEGEIKGEMILRDNRDNYFQLKSAYVKPEAQGKGIGTALVKKAEEKLPETVEVLKASVLKENSEAVKFYKSKGFEKTGEGSLGGEEDSLMKEEHDTLIMEKEI